MYETLHVFDELLVLEVSLPRDFEEFFGLLAEISILHPDFLLLAALGHSDRRQCSPTGGQRRGSALPEGVTCLASGSRSPPPLAVGASDPAPSRLGTVECSSDRICSPSMRICAPNHRPSGAVEASS